MAAPVLRAPGLLQPLRAPLWGSVGAARCPPGPAALPGPLPEPRPVPVRAMAGHNRWSKVRNVKGPRDAERSRLCEKMARMLRAAAREGGPDPSLNPGLAAVVAQCRALNVPKATIEGALRSARERPAGGSQVLLTARGPAGALVLLDVRTDSVRRSQAELRTLLGRHGASLTDDRHAFEAVGVVRVSGRTLPMEAALEVAAVAGAQDVVAEEEAAELKGLVMVVTGGSGFLGSHLVQVLLEAEPELRELRILDLEPDLALVPERHRPRVRLFRGDVGDFGALGAALGGADVVFHSAALVDVWGRCSAEAVARVNVLGTKNVIRGCQAGGVPVLIFTSSMEVVGPNTRGDPFVRGDEETPYPTRHSEPYPLSKAQAERLLLEANGKPVAGGGRLVTLSLRPTGIFGERHALLELFYRRGRGLGGRVPRSLPQNAEHGRVYAGNVAWMHVLAARAARARPASVGGEFFFCYDDSPWAPYEEFNLLLLRPAGLSGGPRLPPALGALLAALNGLLRQILGRFGVFWAPLLNPYTWAVASTPFSVRTGKAERQLGYRPLFSWQEARDRTVGWLRQLDGA